MTLHPLPEITIAIQRLPHGAGLPLPAVASAGAAGMDITAAEDCILPPGGRRAVATGFALVIPPGWEVQLRSRSGLALQHGISCLNAPGTIDSDYRGEIKVILINLSDCDYAVARGDRIAQLVPASVPAAQLIEVSVDIATSDPTIRGTAGFGSTGGACVDFEGETGVGAEVGAGKDSSGDSET